MQPACALFIVVRQPGTYHGRPDRVDQLARTSLVVLGVEAAGTYASLVNLQRKRYGG